MEKASSAKELQEVNKISGTLDCVLTNFTYPKENFEYKEGDTYVVKFRSIKNEYSKISAAGQDLIGKKYKWNGISVQLNVADLEDEGALKITLIKMVDGKEAEESDKVAWTHIPFGRVCDANAPADAGYVYNPVNLGNEQGAYGILGVKFKFSKSAN